MEGELINIKYVVSALVYSCFGMLIFGVGFWILDILTPKVNIWEELSEKKNVAMAIFLGAIAIGISTIIAAAIHG